jgi:hypothetical protein
VSSVDDSDDNDTTPRRPPVRTYSAIWQRLSAVRCSPYSDDGRQA